MWKWNGKVATRHNHGLTLVIEDHGDIWSWRVVRDGKDVDEGIEDSLSGAYAMVEAAMYAALRAR